jgi:hypothetical protein
MPSVPDDDVRVMLLRLNLQGRLTQRKARLYAVAAVRRVWPLLGDERSRRLIEAVERHADGLAAWEEVEEAAGPAAEVARAASVAVRYDSRICSPREANAAALNAAAAAATANPDAGEAAWWALNRAKIAAQMIASATASGETYQEVARAARAAEHAAQIQLVHDLFGPTPPQAIGLDASWLTWDSGTVVRMTRSIYEERRWEDMGVLGDALQEAGCADEVFLSHCRGGPHARGCVVVDALLGLS